MHAHSGGAAINSLKQALHLAVAAAEYYDVVGKGEVGHMDVSSNLNPSVLDGKGRNRIIIICQR